MTWRREFIRKSLLGTAAIAFGDLAAESEKLSSFFGSPERCAGIPLLKPVVEAEEGGSELKPGSGRFQITPENRLFVVYFIEGTDASGKFIAENRLLEITEGGIPGTSVVLPLKQPFSSFFTSTIRAGTKPSPVLDMMGICEGVKKCH